MRSAFWQKFASGPNLHMIWLNDLYRDIGSVRQELERYRRPALHWYVSGLMEW